MRQHELLYFLDALTVWMEREPTREELSLNYWLNRERFAGSASNMRSLLRQLRLGKAIKDRRCGPHCHARHMHITPHGRALLDRWNEEGCESELRTQSGCERGKFTFQQQRFAS